MAASRGSEWGKWDLHVHTPLSFEHQFGITNEEREKVKPLAELEDVDTPDRYDAELWAKYVNELEEIDEIDVLGVTDYFSIEGYKLVEQLSERGYLQNYDLILPNIEFRLNTITGDGKRVNLHVVFSDKLSVSEIKREFLSTLTIKLDGGEERNLSRDSICELGQRAKENYEDDDMSDYAAGCKYVTVDFDDIVKALESRSSIFKGNYLIMLDEGEWSDIDWLTENGSVSQDAEEKRRLLQKAHGLFSGSPGTTEWASGKKDLSEDKIERLFDSIPPVLNGSDSHDFDSLCKPHMERYCWLKAKKSFDGLKQVVFEPTDRVYIGERNPSEFTPIHTIDSIKIEQGYINKQLQISEKEIEFNSNLVTVIGSQGSGKTALLDLIANCFQIRSSEQVDDDNSFIYRIEDSDPNIKTTVEFAGEDVDGFTKQVLETDTVEGPDVLYLPQGKIVEYCRREEYLHERILELVKRSVGKDDPEVVNKFHRKEEEIEQLANDLRRYNSRLYEINPPEVREEKEKLQQRLNEYKTKLDNKKQEINDFKKKHEEELEKTEAEELQDELDEIILDSEEIDRLKEDIKTMLDYLENIEEYNDLIQGINDQTDLIGSDIYIDLIKFESQEETLKKLMGRVESESKHIQQKIENTRKNLEELSEVDEDFSNLLEEKRRLKTEINSIEDSLEDTEEKLDEIEDIKQDRRQTFVDYVETYLELQNIFDDIAEEFSEDEILRDIHLEPKISLDKDLSSEYIEMLDMRGINEEDIKDGLFRLRDIIEGVDSEDIGEDIHSYLDTMEGFRSDLTSNVEQIEFDGQLYGDYLGLSEEIYFQETRMSQLSRGQKGTVLLRIYLAEGEKPLIIDSPEENLDNRFVFDELIDAIKRAKDSRQIFIATHDANLVVNTDSEQVVITNFEQGEIKFETGALEDENVRDEAQHILEGGDEAFKKREEKYHLSPD